MSFCSHIRYRRFSRILHDKAVDACVPINGTLELTYRCNLKCGYCYTGCDHRPNDEMTTNEVIRIIDTIAEHGCLWLLITGGEPLIRKDFRRIYEHARKRGMIITFFTNGTLVTDSIADFLADMRPFNLEITILGATAGTYESLSGVKGSFEKCMNGIKLLLKRGIRVGLKTVITRINVHELPAMRSLAKSLDAPFRFDPTIIPRLDGSHKPRRLSLTPEEIIELEKSDQAYAKEFHILFEKFAEKSHDKRIFSCGGGVSTFTINPYGRLQFCELVAEPDYDLKKGDFAKGWYELIPALKKIPASKDFPCNDCGIQVLCEQCAGWSKLDSGRWDKRVDFLCEVAHLRKRNFWKGEGK